MKQTESYIRENLKKTVRVCRKDEGSLIGLPKPYTVPCISGKFQEMYYWDTYFTNQGLICSGCIGQAKNNVDNMLYLVRRYGKMPNGNRTYYLNRSQPPFLSEMVREIYEQTKDRQWLEEAVCALEREYAFWQTERNSGTGLNRYGGNPIDEKTLCEEVLSFCSRTGRAMPTGQEELARCGRDMYAVAESGWDCSSRFRAGADLYNALDLNSLLFLLEANMEYFTCRLGRAEAAEEWAVRKKKRQTRMNRLLWNSRRGFYSDYLYEQEEVSELFSAAAFYPLFAGLCDEKRAEQTVESLALIEQPYGVAGCENRKQEGKSSDSLQWDYPNGWACLQYIVAVGLKKYGYGEAALRIAEKFIDVVDDNFKRTGNLWEKYNVVTGRVSVTREYATPPMMGWTAGIYLSFLDMLRDA